MPKAVYPGSLDPITHGHIGAIRDTAEAFGEVVVAIGVNPAKNYLFSQSEREELARKATAGIPGVTVTSFAGLLVHFLVRNNLNIVVRGIRNGQDLDENLMQETIGWQQTLAKDLKAFYVPARPGQSFTSSTALKGVLKEQGDVTHLAPLSTIHATQARMLGQYFYGMTGVSGSGKSTLSRKFAEIAEKRNIPFIHVDLDKIAHGILSSEQDPLYAKIRQRIKDAFGPEVLDENGFIVRKKLGEIVFGNPEKLKLLNSLTHEAVFFRMNDMLRGKRGIFLIDTALLAEVNKMSLVNNQVMIVEGNDAEIAARLQKRDNLTPEQVKRRMSSQYTTDAKIETIEKAIADEHYGKLERVSNLNGISEEATKKAFEAMLKNVDLYGELRITSFLNTLGVADTLDAYTAIRKLYAGNERFHHTLAHVIEGVDMLPEFYAHIADKDAFLLAWLFRDATVDIMRNDNEEKSAAILEKLCKSWGIDPALIARAKTMLVASKHGAPASSNDAKLLSDLDIAVIGGSDAEYARYEENIRREFNAIASKDLTQKRRAFLQGLNDKGFQSDYFRQQRGDNATQNIRKGLALLPKA